MSEVKKEVSKDGRTKVLVKEFNFTVEAVVLTGTLLLIFALGSILTRNPAAMFAGCGFFALAYILSKKAGYYRMKKQVVDCIDEAVKAREAKFVKDGQQVLLNNFVINEIYCDIQGPRQGGSFVVVCQMHEPTGKEFLYVYRHEEVDGRSIAADDLITMEEEALGRFTTLLIEQGLDAVQIMDHIEYRVKDKILARKASRGAKDENDNGGTESGE